ncbi:hypothetical protein L3Q82_025189 [Scortum barcoo]|uniref:Uncharacterized protein n=1 Tax=Scortum barcoo TaxID=214431 RepID=A0ACB8WUR1_9TELE|nr:hypothetical protein L3Q82_025189 [Scortum barcoo]
MNEEPVESPVPGKEPEGEDVGQSTETKGGEADNTSEAEAAPESLAPSDSTKESPRTDPAEEISGEIKEEPMSTGGEPPVDWFEPLEDDDDANSVSRDDAEEESLAGESEKSESLVGSEKAMKKIYHLHIPRRKRSHPDEGWIEWPILGEGWKRKEVVRRSGCSMGQKDVYYMSPQGERVRSRVELASVLEGVLDLSAFEYKTGTFYEGEAPPIRIRNRVKRKMRERSSSESSWMDRGEGADTPDSHHRLTPNPGPKNLHSNQTSFSSHGTLGTPNQGLCNEDPPVEEKIKLPLPSSSRPLPLPSINGEIGSEDSTLICARCGISFTGTWYDKQRKRPCCPTCWAASKTKEHPMIRFRKWIPCGQCVGCHNTVNCGQCANCKHGLQSPESRKRICRKRKCICPIRKGPGSGGFLQQKPYNDIPETFDDSMSFQSEVTDSQHLSLKSSDTENFSVNVDVEDEDDMSTDDDDDRELCLLCSLAALRAVAAGRKDLRDLSFIHCGWSSQSLKALPSAVHSLIVLAFSGIRSGSGDPVENVKPVSAGKDCGTCDFCIDKPKFGGSNKKRQKCRLRQCVRDRQ